MKDPEYFKSKLSKLEQDILARIATIDADLRQKTPTAPDDQAIELENAEVLDSLRITAKDELLQVEGALQRIDAGTYLTCSICDGEIPASRLEALPFTAHCLKCAEELEHQ